MDVDPAEPVPLYFQVKNLMMRRISSGAYLPGDRIPTEQEICLEFGISRTPVHRALAELADEGVVIRRRRYGTVVNPHWLPSRVRTSEVKVLVASDEWLGYVRRAAPPDVEVNVVAVGYPNLHRHISRAVAEGQAPDLVLLDSVWVREFAEAGMLAPLDDLAPSWIAEHYRDFVPRFEHQSRPYAVSAEANVAGLWFRRPVFESSGVTPPRTWSELLAVAGEVAATAPKHAPLAMPLGIRAGETTTYCLVGLLATNGARVTTDAGVVLDSEQSVETLHFVVRMVAEGVVSPQSVTYEWDRAPELLAKGGAIMSIGGTYEAPLIAEAAGLELSAVEDLFGFVPIPHGPQGGVSSVVGGMAYAIPKQAKRPLDAMRVLRALVEPASVSDLAFATGTLPGRRSVVESVAKHLPLVQVAAEVMGSAVLRPQTIAYNRVSKQLQLMVESVVLGRMTPEEATKRTAEHIAAITDLAVIGQRLDKGV